MKKIVLALLLLHSGITGFCTTWTINNVGWHFSPDTITITLGDSVNFDIHSSHHVVEVSEATWNLNDSTPLPGFSTGMGGGLALPAQLTAGTHWYVCPEHIEEPMKAVIIVQNITNIFLLDRESEKSTAYPNPFANKVIIETYAGDMISIYKLTGEKIKSGSLNKSQSKFEFDASELTKGI
jgi:plastocyanin